MVEHGHLGDAIRAALTAGANDIALEADGAHVSASELLDAGVARARKLEASVPAGSVVVVCAGQGAEFWIDLVSVWVANCVAAPVDGSLGEGPRAEILALARPAAVVGARNRWELTKTARAPLPESVAAILFTSGSTGRPKGVVLSHGSLLGNCYATLERIDVRRGDRLATAIPYHFTSAVCHFLAAVMRGATLTTTSTRMLPADFLAFLRARKPTAFGGSPLQLRWIAEGAPSATLRWVMSSGDRLSTDVVQALRRDGKGPDVVAVYGMTEVGGRMCILDPGLADSSAGAVGNPIAGLNIEIRDEAGVPCPTGVSGEVHVRGDWLFEGYLDDAEATAAVFNDGILRTGDLGAVDGQGLLRLLGRADDVFKVAGQKVSGQVIVDALMATAYFSDVAVLPVERVHLGSVPEAWVVWRDSQLRVPKRELLARLRQVLPPNHLPLAVHELERMPRVGSGKVDRHALRKGVE